MRPFIIIALILAALLAACGGPATTPEPPPPGGSDPPCLTDLTTHGRQQLGQEGAKAELRKLTARSVLEPSKVVGDLDEDGQPDRVVSGKTRCSSPQCSAAVYLSNLGCASFAGVIPGNAAWVLGAAKGDQVMPLGLFRPEAGCVGLAGEVERFRYDGTEYVPDGTEQCPCALSNRPPGCPAIGRAKPAPADAPPEPPSEEPWLDWTECHGFLPNGKAALLWTREELPGKKHDLGFRIAFHPQGEGIPKDVLEVRKPGKFKKNLKKAAKFIKRLQKEHRLVACRDNKAAKETFIVAPSGIQVPLKVVYLDHPDPNADTTIGGLALAQPLQPERVLWSSKDAASLMVFDDEDHDELENVDAYWTDSGNVVVVAVSHSYSKGKHIGTKAWVAPLELELPD